MSSGQEEENDFKKIQSLNPESIPNDHKNSKEGIAIHLVADTIFPPWRSFNLQRVSSYLKRIQAPLCLDFCFPKLQDQDDCVP